MLRKQQVLIMNRKIQMTKRFIRLALFECLKEKDINKITISSLCEKADINRSTFYKYYGSQYDVIKEMEQEVIQLINKQLNDQPKETSFIQLLQFLKLKCSQFPSCVDFTGFNGIQNCVYCYYLSFFSKIALKHRPHYFHI